MKLITRQDWANKAAEQWEIKFYRFVGSSRQKEHIALKALGDNADPDEVDRIIGYDWTRSSCNRCEDLVDAVVKIDCVSLIEGFTKGGQYCLNCLEEARNYFADAVSLISGIEPVVEDKPKSKLHREARREE